MIGAADAIDYRSGARGVTNQSVPLMKRDDQADCYDGQHEHRLYKSDHIDDAHCC